MQISQPLQNSRKIQKPEFKTEIRDNAISTADLILYFEQCCIAVLGLAVAYSLQQQQPREGTAVSDHRILPSHEALHLLKVLRRALLRKKLFDQQDSERHTSLALTELSHQAVPKTPGGDGLKTVPPQSYCM